MASQSILNGYESSSHTSMVSQPETNSSQASSLVSQPETNRKVQITVKDTAKSKQVKSTTIVIEIDEGMSSQEIREANRTKASKMRLYGFEHKDEDFTEQFIQLLELCLKYEFSDGMMRILIKSIIPYYKSADKKYIESMEFQKFLEGIINRITDVPHRKFSALKDLCDTLKKAQTKKRANFVTIQDYVSDAIKRKLANPKETPKKPRIVDVIDLDQLYESPVIDLDQLSEPTVIDLDTLPNCTTSDDIIIIDDEQKNCSDTNKHNPPNKMESDTLSDEQKQVLAKIKTLEEQIKYHKREIKTLDEMEVCSDTIQSPYILSDFHQAEILKLYKIICKLSGQNSVTQKSKRVKLKVKEGHPTGPAKKLEEWLKENTEDGDPPFPDFIDVVKCVSDAIAEEGLRWTKEAILAEARMLFTECGRALQKRRQMREYRDLISKVKHFDVDKDPADDDPALLRRLEENRMIANRKEAAIIEEYAQIKTYNRTKVNQKIVVLQKDPTTENNNAQEANLNIINNNSVSQSNGDFHFEVPVVTVVNIVQASQLDIKDSQKTEIDVKPVIVPRPIDPTLEIICSDSEDYSSSENEASDFELDDVVPEKNALINAGESSLNTNDFAQSIVITNVKSESAPQNINIEANTNEIGDPTFVITNISSEYLLSKQAPDHAEITDQVTKINSTPTLQNDSSIPTEAYTNEPTFVITNIVSESTLQTIPADNANIISDQITTTSSSHPLENDIVVNNDSAAKYIDSTITKEIASVINCELNAKGTGSNPDLVENCNDIIIKKEPAPSTAEETLKMLLEFEKNIAINGISVKTTIFDFDQEPIVCIEISSSESESDSDDENGTDDDDNDAAVKENCETSDQCG